MTPTSRLAEFAHSVCLEAGELMMKHFGRIRHWDVKHDRSDIVTEADREVERMVRQRVSLEMPGHGVLGEEEGMQSAGEGKPVWIVDPVDGTRNFAFGIPIFAISLACVIDGEPTVGVIYDPVHREMFAASASGGATLNGEPILVSDSPGLKDSLISVSWTPTRSDIDLYQRTVARVNRRTSYFRRIGSAALVLAYVASGRFDGYVQAGINPWDIAAGILLVREAGGVVTGFDGSSIDLASTDIDLVAGNRAVHFELLQEVIQRPGTLEEEVQTLRQHLVGG